MSRHVFQIIFDIKKMKGRFEEICQADAKRREAHKAKDAEGQRDKDDDVKKIKLEEVNRVLQSQM